MTVPDELVQAVHDAAGHSLTVKGCGACIRWLNAVPDGWARIDGEWVRVGLNEYGALTSWRSTE